MSQGRPVTDSTRVAGLRLAEGATSPGMQAASGSGSGLAGNGSSASIPRGAQPARAGGSARAPHIREVRVCGLSSCLCGRVLWQQQEPEWSVITLQSHPSAGCFLMALASELKGSFMCTCLSRTSTADPS